MSVIGEALLLAALLLVAVAAGSTDLALAPAAVAAAAERELILALLVAGFGIKLGLLGLHMWLPLAHPVAPASASALLSGAMVAAGLLGWLRFLPGGEASLPGLGLLLAALGIAGALLAVLAGLTQHRLKTVLAYSTVSQMGVMSAVVGLGMAAEAAWGTAVAVTAFYIVVHGLAKAALFVGAGALGEASGRSRLLVLAGLAAAALIIAAAPATGGALAKEGAGELAATVPAGWAERFGWALSASAVATALLLGHALRLAIRTPAAAEPGEAAGSRALAAALGLLVAAAATAPAWVPELTGLGLPAPVSLQPAKLWDSLWPLGAAAAIGLALLRIGRAPALPAGDLIVPILAVLGWLAAIGRRAAAGAASARAALGTRLGPLRAGTFELGGGAERVETGLARWPIAALGFALLILSLALVLS
jgi:formate hydrogenlyase subunit 3/multisubunit Na+/H+ antiporter MnhD subunit